MTKPPFLFLGADDDGVSPFDLFGGADEESEIDEIQTDKTHAQPAATRPAPAARAAPASKLVPAEAAPEAQGGAGGVGIQLTRPVGPGALLDGDLGSESEVSDSA